MQHESPSATGANFGDKLSKFVFRFRVAIIIGWLLAAIIAKSFAPSWKDIAYDGDFDYLPKSMPSVSAERLLNEAFPTQRSRSQLVLIISRDGSPLEPLEVFDDADEVASIDLLRRLYHRMSEVVLANLALPANDFELTDTQKMRLGDAKTFLDEAIRLDQVYFEMLTSLNRIDSIPASELRLTLAYWDRGNVLQQLGEDDLAASDTQAALVLEPKIAEIGKPFDERDLKPWRSLVDLHSWEEAIIGSQMAKPNAKLAVLLSNAELAATSNIDFLSAVQELRDGVLSRHQAFLRPGLEILATGSAAIGGQTLTAARDAIRYTELLTVILILGILGVVYRAPLLIVIPVLSIGIAVMVSSGIVAWLSVASAWLDSPWFDLKVFTTSRIFVVVILFGAGTDFCLFLISRLREEAERSNWDKACEKSLSGVSIALFGSALTTIVGLAMLGIADFGKFSHTGPIVALCLTIGLMVCLTFTPAILSLAGPIAFWPVKIVFDGSTEGSKSSPSKFRAGLWGLIAVKLTQYPVTAIVLGLAILMPPAILGYLRQDEVTYDISSQLDRAAESRRGLRLVEQYFDIGRINPITLLITLPRPIEADGLKANSKDLAEKLYGIEGVVGVRSADDPLGDFPPDRTMSLLSTDAWRRRALKTHRIARDYFFSAEPRFQNRLTRLDLILSGNPFEIATAQKVKLISIKLNELIKDENSVWHNADVRLAGATPSIMDLRTVTLSDNRRIKVAVVVAVFAALWLVIRRVSLCGYLIATVLLSFYATLGATILFFQFAYGDDYVGLDWKLPLFLFVILVAVGQDYNVYLVTRIAEEQLERPGWLSALRRAVSRTGGIITACGLVMGATFFSMTASAWLPSLLVGLGLSDKVQSASLRGVVELGFALGLGVLIDTFYVRTILVPSFVTLIDRLRSGHRLPTFPEDSDHG